ncbi:hypothetical protein SLS62_009390 [Diatrype stigma]|uniref:AB hydrolase-1 domain-containing protein n=1 Tax=Diatrype stigma TaxID=117547 RepID=A0AAN9UF30_9PEZI
MFDGFESFKIRTQADPEVDIYGLKSAGFSPERPALLLLHGFPQTHHIWHRVAPPLAEKYNVVMIDIRGYGQSSKPGSVSAYAKSAMARDCVAVMDGVFGGGGTEQQQQPFFVCAHDRGARVAHKLCVDFPARVRKAVFLDICPTLAMYAKTDYAFATAYWHWFFLIQKEPLPESLIAGNAHTFAELFMGGRQEKGLRVFDEGCFDVYVKSLEDPDTVHAMCHDYRASATLDMDEAREDLKAGRLLKTPLLVLWGKNGVIEKCFDALKEWRAVAEDGVTVQGHSVDSGHYIPEEASEELTSAVLEFLV